MICVRICVLVFCLLHLNSQAQKLQMTEHPVRLKNKLSFSLKLPKGYRISIAAEGLKRPRFFAKSPDGRLFVTDMYDRNDNRKGRILILDGWNEKEKTI